MIDPSRMPRTSCVMSANRSIDTMKPRKMARPPMRGYQCIAQERKLQFLLGIHADFQLHFSLFANEKLQRVNANPWHQYATDPTWQLKIARIMATLYIREGIAISDTGLIFDIPTYRK